MAQRSSGSTFACLAALVAASCGDGPPASRDGGVAADGPPAIDGAPGPEGSATLYVGSGASIHHSGVMRVLMVIAPAR